MAAPLWLPGATVVKAASDGGSMTGSDAYVTWHTFECDYTVSAVVGARALNAHGDSVHLTFNPVTGEVAQMIPANRAGRGLLNAAGGVETNRQGRVNIQIEVIARASRPWTRDLTAKGRTALAGIIRWLDALGVPRIAPNGFVGPATYAASTKRARSLQAWNGPGGYFCHADAPENDHWDHGAVDMRDLWAVTSTQGDAMSFDTDEERQIRANVRSTPITLKDGSTDTLEVRVADLVSSLAALDKKVSGLAPAQPTVITDAQLERVLRKVVGSVDNTPPA